MAAIFDIYSIEKWRTLQIDDIYYPIFQLIIRIFMDFTFVLSAFLYFFIAFVILTKTPKPLESFKYTVLVQISCNIIYKCFLFFTNPIFFFPLPLLSCDAYFQFTVDWVIPGIIFVALTIITGGVTILLSVLIRTIAVFEPTVSINTFFIKSIFVPSKRRFRFCIIFSILTIFIIGGILYIPFISVRQYLEPSLESIAIAVPAVLTVQKIFPNTFALNPKFVGSSFLIGLILIGILIFIFNILFVALNILFVRQLKKIRRIVSTSAYGVHTMLYRTIIIQLVNLLVFLVFPCYTFGTVYLFQFTNGARIGNFCLAFTSFHLIADIFCLIRFIRPYRRYVLKLLLKK